MNTNRYWLSGLILSTAISLSVGSVDAEPSKMQPTKQSQQTYASIAEVVGKARSREFIVDPDKSIKMINDELKFLLPDVAELHSCLASALSFKGHSTIHDATKRRKLYESAVNEVSKAIRLNPNKSYYYHQRGMFQVDAGRLDRAVSDVSVAIKMNPADGSYYVMRGQYYLKQKKFKESLLDLDKAISIAELDKNSEMYLINLVNDLTNRTDLFIATRRYDKALADLDKSLSLLKQANVDSQTKSALLSQTYGRFSELYLMQAKYRQALDICNEGLKALTPEFSSFLLFQQARAYEGLGQNDKALDSYVKATKASPNDGEAHYRLGKLREKLKQTNAAEKDFRKAKELGYKPEKN